MGSAVIGSLRVNLSADTAAFNKGLSDAEKRAEAFGRKIGTGIRRSAIALTAATTAAGASISAMVPRAIEAGSAIGDLAKRVGISAEALQEFSFAATQSGSSQEAFVTAMTRMAASLGAAQRGSEAAQAEFRSLGLSFSDIKGQAPEEVFTLIAERISRLQDPLQRNAALMRLFGRSGAEMAELMSEGARGIEALRDQARRLGLVLSNQEIARFKAAGDQLDIIGRAAGVAGQKFAIGFLPALETIADIMTDPQFQEGMRKAGERMGKLVTVIADNADAVVRVAGALAGIAAGRMFGGYGAAAGGILGAFTPELVELLDKLGDGKQVPELVLPFPVVRGEGGDGGGGVEGWESPQADEMARRLEMLRASLMTEREAELAAYEQRLTDLQEFQDARLLSEQEANDLRSAAEKEHRAAMIELDRQAAERRLMIFQGYTSAFASALESIGSIIGDEGKKQFEINKKLSIAAATVKGLEAVVSSYAAGARIGGPPLGAAFAAAAALATGAQIAAIARQTYNGGGGKGAVASAGSTSQPAAPAAAGGVQQGFNITLQGETFGREQVRKLIEQMGEAYKLGAPNPFITVR